MKQNAIFHANCQGEMLLDMLRRHPPFAEKYECRLFTNYARKEVPEEQLRRCDLFVYQHLGPQWGALASERLMACLPRNCQTIAMPNMFLRLYWPLHRGGSRPHELRDRLLDDLLARGVPPTQLGVFAQKASILSHYDLKGIVEQSLERELAKEARADIPHVALLQELGVRERCFYTVNHPGEKLLCYVADEVLRRIALPPLEKESLAPLEWYYTALELPINPAVAEVFGLDFVQENTLYNVYGFSMSYGQFAQLYGRYMQGGGGDFIAYVTALNT